MIQTTVITPTIGSDSLVRACESIARQSYPCLHLLVVDGREYEGGVKEIAFAVQSDNPSSYWFEVLTLPWNTGASGHYGHVIYAGVPSFIKTRYFSFLDQDNAYAHDWVFTMQRQLELRESSQYVTCRRTVYDADGNLIGRDNKESVGENEMGYRLYDTSTWMFRASMSILTPYISIPYHKGDDGSWGGDRSLTDAVYNVSHHHLSEYHGTHYYAPERLTQFFKEICDE